MTPQPITLTHADPLSVDRRLERMGLQREQIERAVFISEYHRDQRTDNDAPGAPGWIAYTWCVRALREILTLLGWERSNDQNRATIVSPDHKINIAVVVGDEGTGRSDMDPDVVTPKGQATRRAVAPNQPNLFGENQPFVISPIFGFSDMQSWFLLRRRTENAVFIELSLPTSIVDGHVEGWLERIILGRYDYETQFNIVDESDDETIEIPISRRQQ